MYRMPSAAAASCCLHRARRRALRPLRIGVLLAAGLGIPPALPAAAGAGDLQDYLDLPLEDLLAVEVSSVSRRPESLADAAAAVHVITGEEIRRSGATSIAEALRMVPGLHVARINASQWAISARGFTGVRARKLLVLMDGRTVYTPSFSGVYWDAQDTLLEDIDRIEVIRGPGATLWGANAVNGIINIITRPAEDTTGTLALAGAGTELEHQLALRHGSALGAAAHGRAYVKRTDRDGFQEADTGADAGDDWDTLRGGFRIDGEAAGGDRWTLQGDVYELDGRIDYRSYFVAAPPYQAPRTDAFDARGWNVLGRWERSWSEASRTTLQAYWDRAERDELQLGQRHDTLDLDFKHDWQAGRHHVVWGLGYRRIRERYDNTFAVSVMPPDHDVELYSAFVQDEIAVVPERLRLILGSKVEHNEYTGVEAQPSARFVWTPEGAGTVWGAVSRAVRTPSRIEDSARVVTAVVPMGPPGTPPVVAALRGSEDLDAEELVAWELGYRTRIRDDLALDLALYRHEYDRLVSGEPVLGTRRVPVPDIVFANEIEGRGRGLELALDWLASDAWRLQAAYAYHDGDFERTPEGADPFGPEVAEGSYPRHQLSLRSAQDLGAGWSLDLQLHYVDSLPAASIGALRQDLEVGDYWGLHGRLAWQAAPGVEVALVGRNLLEAHHLEFVPEANQPPTEVERSAFLQVRWEL